MKIFPFFRIVFLLIFPFAVNAQQPRNFDAQKLQIQFSVTENDYNWGGKTSATLSIINNNQTALPASGWKIYFNNKSMLKKEDDHFFTITKKNGNLFELRPAADFKALSKNEKAISNVFIGDPVYNKNDQPEGFYIVWDNDPKKGYNIRSEVFNDISAQKNKTSDFAAVIFARNEMIDRNAKPTSTIFPTPVNYVQAKGTFAFSVNTTIIADDRFKKETDHFKKEIQLLFKSSKIITNGIFEIIFKEGLGDEGYEFEITSDKIQLSATTAAGAFYGLQSFKMMLPPDIWKQPMLRVDIPNALIKDAPLFSYRGQMIDVARDFQTKEEILRILNLMSLYKMNRFHFHLTDDEGWRLEIRGIPELTEFGSQRGHTLDEKGHLPSAYGSGADIGKLYGSGYFTRDDFKEILRYAKDRHITIIPEIESPGHARAAIKAMDFRYKKYLSEGNRDEALRYLLRDTLDRSEYTTPQWFHDNVMNAALPSTYTFMKKVGTEIAALYKEAGVPLTSIHIGGDEVPAGTWEKSPACNALIASDPTLHNTNDLWYYYVGNVSRIMKEIGVPISGWEEIGLRKTMVDGNKVMIPNPDFLQNDLRLWVWNNIGGNEDLAYRLANSGYKVVLTPVTNFYLDMTQFKTYDEPGYYWGSVTDISKTYEFIPFDFLKNVKEDDQGRPVSSQTFANKQRLTDYGKENILGLQGALWAETLKGPQQLEYMLLPRLVALAERTWAQTPSWAITKDSAIAANEHRAMWSAFVQQIGTQQLPLLDHYNGGYNYRVPPAGAIVKDEMIRANTQFPGLTIYYTTDGSEPTTKSRIYTSPLPYKTTVKFKVFNKEGRGSYVTTVVNE